MSCCLHVDVVTKDGDDKVSVKAKGTDDEIVQMIMDAICALSAKGQYGLSPRTIIKTLNDSLEEWE